VDFAKAFASIAKFDQCDTAVQQFYTSIFNSDLFCLAFSCWATIHFQNRALLLSSMYVCVAYKTSSVSLTLFCWGSCPGKCPSYISIRQTHMSQKNTQEHFERWHVPPPLTSFPPLNHYCLTTGGPMSSSQMNMIRSTSIMLLCGVMSYLLHYFKHTLTNSTGWKILMCGCMVLYISAVVWPPSTTSWST
jgi:hypothetical protein